MTLRALVGTLVAAGALCAADPASAEARPEKPPRFVVATTEVAKAAPDGYTMLLGFNGPLAFAPLLGKLPHDVSRDLAPVIITSSQPNVLAVNAEIAARNVPELVALANAQPGWFAYAPVGNGSSSHLNMELFMAVAGFDAIG